MIVSVISLNYRRCSLFSTGVGERDDTVVHFILPTADVPQLERDLKLNSNLRIDLAPWQYAKDRMG